MRAKSGKQDENRNLNLDQLLTGATGPAKYNFKITLWPTTEQNKNLKLRISQTSS